MAPNYSVHRQMSHRGPTWCPNCCSLGAARWRQTTAYTIKCVIVRPLGVKNAALLEQLDGAALPALAGLPLALPALPGSPLALALPALAGLPLALALPALPGLPLAFPPDRAPLLATFFLKQVGHNVDRMVLTLRPHLFLHLGRVAVFIAFMGIRSGARC